MINASDITPRWLFWFLTLTLVLITVSFGMQYYGLLTTLTGLPIHSDPMYVSGFITILAALWLSMPVESRFVALANELEDEQTVHDGSGRFRKLAQSTASRARGFGYLWSAIVGLVVGTGFYLFYFHSGISSLLHCAQLHSWAACWNRFKDIGLMEYFVGISAFFSVSVYLGLFVGQRLGVMAGLATAIRSLSKPNVHLRLVPSHNDGHGGLKGLASYLAGLGIIASIPVIWLGIWLVMINQSIAPLTQNYTNWSFPFVLQLTTALILFTFCFILPFRSLTQRYRAELQAQLRQAEIELKARLQSLQPGADERSLEEYRHLRNLQKLPRYPIAPQLNSIFSFTSVTPFFMLALGVALGSNSFVVRIADFFLG